MTSLSSLDDLDPVSTPDAADNALPEGVKLFALSDLPERGDLVEAIHRLLAEVRDHDGVAALGEAFERGVDEDRGHRHVVAVSEDSAVVGVLAIDGDRTVELAVAPGIRHRGLAWQMFIALASEHSITGAIDVWAHGDLSKAQDFVSRLDARRTRELLKMAVIAAPGSPARAQLTMQVERAHTRIAEQNLELLPYSQAVEKWGEAQVDEEWVRVNNEAFAWHPEQGGWSLEHLVSARQTDWFNPDMVWMLWDEGRCLGFHWLKLPVAEQDMPEGERTGEVYVVCLADEARGRHLGGAITLVGIGDLLERGCREVELYVEGDNAPAVATYQRLGFSVVHTDVVYRGMLQQ